MIAWALEMKETLLSLAWRWRKSLHLWPETKTKGEVGLEFSFILLKINKINFKGNRHVNNKLVRMPCNFWSNYTNLNCWGSQLHFFELDGLIEFSCIIRWLFWSLFLLQNLKKKIKNLNEVNTRNNILRI